MEEIKKYLKKRFKKSRILPIIIIIFYLVSFFLGNFLHESRFLKRINPFTYLFGKSLAEIDPTNIIYKQNNYTRVKYRISNIGDKDIENLFVNYKFCGLPLKTASLIENKLRIDEYQYFDIETVNLNPSCSFSTEPAKLDIFFDVFDKCYVKIESPTRKTCGFCGINFDIFGNNKQILSEIKYQPYYEIDVSTLELMKKMGLDVSFNPKNHSSFNLSECLFIKDPTRFDIEYFSTVDIFIFDPFTYCLQGKDPEWCAQNIYVNP